MTNYGLGGLVEDHNDPYGYNEGTRLSPELSDLAHSGDIMATVMGEQFCENSVIGKTFQDGSPTPQLGERPPSSME